MPRKIPNILSALGLGIAIIAFLTGHASASQKTLLQLDTGGHRAMIRDVAFTHDGKYLVSAGEDKMIRIWNIKKGKTVRILRGEAGSGNPGKLYTLAISRDDRWLAVAGWTGQVCDETDAARCGDIRVYDMRDGKLKTLLKGHKNVVRSLAFSKNGALLSASDDATAILWDIDKALNGQDGTIKVRYQDEVSEYLTGARFLPGGSNIVTTDSDGIMRIWPRKGGKPIKTIIAHENEQRIFALDVSPNGQLIATGSVDGTLRLFRADSGRHIHTIKQGNYVSALKFSPDSKKILTGTAGQGPWIAFVWDVASGKKLISYAKHDNVVNAVAFSRDGQTAVTAGGTGKEIHLWGVKTGETKKILRGSGSTVFAVGFVQKRRILSLVWGKIDPCPVQLSCPNEPGKIQFKMRLASKKRGLQRPRKWKGKQQKIYRTITSTGEVRLDHRKNLRGDVFDTVRIVGSKQKSKITRYDYSDGKEHLSYSLSAAADMIISAGRNGALQAYGLDGREKRKGGVFNGHTGDIWSLAVSPDGRFVASGSDDQTVRLWNAKTGELIISLFHGDNGEWIVWTPQGYYTSSGNGDKMVGWQVNQGAEKEARFLNAEQLSEHLNQPFIIHRAIIHGSAKKAAEEYLGDEDDLSDHHKLQELLKLKAPDFNILSPQPGREIDDYKLKLQLHSEVTKIDKMEYQIWVNGVKVERRRGFIPISSKDNSKLELSVPLFKGDNEIRILARNTETLLTSERWISVKGTRSGGLGQKGTLYLLAIGVNHYPHIPGNELYAAVADATAFLDQVIQTTPHDKIVARLLVDNPQKHKISNTDPARVELLSSLEPTAINIIMALEMFKSAKPQDTTIIFIAGHGVNEKGRYLFLPGSAKRKADGDFDAKSVVDWRTFDLTLAATRGRRILFNDSCHSGNAFNEKFVNDSADDMVIAFSAADTETEAEELSGNKVKHGIFTDALLRAIKGDADITAPKGQIHFKELELFVTQDVIKNSKYGQIPEVNSRHFKPFVFARP